MTTALPADPESVFTYGAPQLKFGSGASAEIGFDLSTYGVRRVLVLTDPGLAATGIPQRVADQMAAYGIEAQALGRRARRADRREPAAGGRRGPRVRAVGRVRRGRRRLDHRHRQGRQPADDQPRRADGLRQRAGRPRAGADAAAQAAGRGADHHRHRLREHDHLRDGRAAPQGEDRHQPRPAAPHARRRRPRPDPDAARRRHRGVRHGHPVPRAGELHRALVHQRRAQGRRAAGAVLRLQPDLGHVVGEGDGAAGRRRSGAPCGTATTSRRASTWRWPRPSPGSASATPACTCRTPTPTRSPGR